MNNHARLSRKATTPSFLLALWLAPLATVWAAELIVYPPVPGLAPSAHYLVRVRPAGEGGVWQDAFAWETACKTTARPARARW